MKGFVIAGTHSGVGKTTISKGLMLAFKNKGYEVQPFKVGPDFIDPMHHAQAVGRTSQNLDGWMLSKKDNVELFYKHSDSKDIAIVEGVMGLFDGHGGKSESGSTAEMAKWLGLPVILVVDASAMSRSAAAMVKGYMDFDPDLNVAGVILSKVAGQTHFEWLRDAIEGSLDIKVLGGIPRDPRVHTKERHLGLNLPGENKGEDQKRLLAICELVKKYLDLEVLSEISKIEDVLQPKPCHSRGGGNLVDPRSESGMTNCFEPLHAKTKETEIRMAVARDEAFCFYYEDNFELLSQRGVELIPFSPLRDELPGNIDCIYIGGGYPEIYAKQISLNEKLREQIQEFGLRGGRIYAECGGLIYLSQSIEDFEGNRYEMCGLFDFETRMVKKCQLGYVELEVVGNKELGSIRGHFFHYSEIFDAYEGKCCYHIPSLRGEPRQEGYLNRNVLASYIHLHFRSNPKFIDFLLAPCETNLKERIIT